MISPRLAVLALLLGATVALADDAREKCLDLHGARDTAEYVAPGLRVIVTVRNGCGEDHAGSSLRFRVNVRSRNGGTAGTQTGRFAGTVKAGGSAETVVFVACDTERAGEIEVELLK